MTPPPALIQSLAEDVKHQRKVAVKFLRPELAATLGPERFARDIAVAARLQHPHILGLLDSGEVDGFFYYTQMRRGHRAPHQSANRKLSSTSRDAGTTESRASSTTAASSAWV